MGQKWSQKVIGDCPEREYTPEESMKHVRELIKVDSEYRLTMNDGVHTFLAFRMADMGKPDEVRQAVANPETIKLSGSCADGGAICRWFRSGIPDVELDITYQVGIITADKESSIVEELPEKPGFVKIYNSRKTYECLHPILSRDRPELSAQFDTKRYGQTYVNTMTMQDDISAIWPHMDGEGVIPQISAMLMGVDENLLTQTLVQKVQGPSNMMELVISLRDEPAIAYSSDSILALKSEKMPENIKASFKRFEKFLPPRILSELHNSSTHIVPKKSPTATTLEEWRRSTTDIENILMKNWKGVGADQKMVCFFMLKSLYYRYIRGIEVKGEYISSYALKTEFMWVVEEMDATEWTDANFMKNMKTVLQRLLKDIRRRIIDNYLLPELNIIDPAQFPEELLEAVGRKLEEMVNDLESFMPRDLERIIKLGDAINVNLKVILSIIQYMTRRADRKHKDRNNPLAGLTDVVDALNSAGVDVPGLLMGLLGNKR